MVDTTNININIPYVSHINKNAWDYMTKICEQINNINLSESLDSKIAEIENILFFVISKKQFKISFNLFVALSHKKEDLYVPFIETWLNLKDITYDNQLENLIKENEILVYTFDIKKYNSVVTFSKEYQERNNIELILDYENNVLKYEISKNNYIILSSALLNNCIDIKNKVIDSYNKRSNTFNQQPILSISNVDKNSFLLPYMAYKDFLNFTVHSSQSKTYIYNNRLINYLEVDNKLLFLLDVYLREDKFTYFNNKEKILKIPSGLWQIFVILQQNKTWQFLDLYDDFTCIINFASNYGNINVIHTLEPIKENESYTLDFNYSAELVGNLSSNELYKINKLYSNANRTCYFNFINQNFIGNNYVFNKDKLEQKITELEDKIENTTIPLKISFTELKHYIGSDLSQKSFQLKVYTDGINVILEKYQKDTNNLDCKILFNHLMSKKNQNLPNIS